MTDQDLLPRQWKLRLPGPWWCALMAIMLIATTLGVSIWYRYHRIESIKATARAEGASLHVETFELAWVTGLMSRWPDWGSHVKPLFERVTYVLLARSDRLLSRLEGGQELTRVSARGTGVTDRGVKSLLTLPKLNQLWLIDASITDDGLSRLASNDQLRTLCVRSDQLTGVGLRSFRNRANLKFVLIGGENFDESELEPLVTMPDLRAFGLFDLTVTARSAPYLEQLDNSISVRLYGVSMSTEAWQAVGSYKRLRHLWGYKSTVTDADMAEIGGLVRLESLWICNGQISDAGLAHLGRLKRLRTLLISDADVTDAGVKFLADHLDLTRLQLASTKITAACVDDLNRFPSLKDLNIHDTPLKNTPAAVARLHRRIHHNYGGASRSGFE